MQFKTIRHAHKGSERFTGALGVPGQFFAFDYELSKNPECETVCVQLGPGLDWFAEEGFWESAQAGVRLGIGETAQRGTRLCCLHLSILGTKIHDVDTTRAVVESRLADLIQSRIMSWAEPLAPLAAEWLTADVVALAKGIHADGATDRFPILSDALRDAGCEDPFVHDHLQLCPDHGTSCWVVEMILGQTRAAGA